jgi:hypothetical protein
MRQAVSAAAALEHKAAKALRRKEAKARARVATASLSLVKVEVGTDEKPTLLQPGDRNQRSTKLSGGRSGSGKHGTLATANDRERRPRSSATSGPTSGATAARYQSDGRAPATKPQRRHSSGQKKPQMSTEGANARDGTKCRRRQRTDHRHTGGRPEKAIKDFVLQSGNHTGEHSPDGYISVPVSKTQNQLPSEVRDINSFSMATE